MDDNLSLRGIRRAIGEELKKARERKEIMLEDVAHETKINLEYLKSIEAGEFNFLPQAYVRAFIRSYAQKVGLDPMTMLKPLDRIRERILEEKSNPPEDVDNQDESPSDKFSLAKIKKLFLPDNNLYLLLF